jgi:hypothetical protein
VLEVRSMRAEEIPTAAHVVARGMADNPIHVAAWPEPAKRSRALTITFSSGQ